jgi:hypothetical protein
MTGPTIGKIIIVFVLLLPFVIVGTWYWIHNRKKIKQRILRQRDKFIEFLIKEKHKFEVLIKIYKELNYNFHSHAIEITLHLFTHFYEKNFIDIENSAFPDDDFPNGKVDIVNVYNWITKIRRDNYIELTRLRNSEYNMKTQSFEFHGAHFQSLKHKIDAYGELKVIPLSDVVYDDGGVRNHLNFEKRLMKIENNLYDLDTQIHDWIIKRRRYFKI